jgi:hypothetical protein
MHIAGHVLDAKVVNYKREGDGVGFVAPQSRGEVLGRFVAVLGQVFCMAFVGNDAGMQQPMHALPNLDVDPTVVNKNLEVCIGSGFLVG